MSCEKIEIAFGDARLAITGHRDLLDGARARFEHFIASESTSSTEREIALEHNGLYRFTDSRGASAEEESVGRLLRTLEARVLEIFIAANPQFVWLHAAAVSNGDRGVLILGRFGSGKSTLSHQFMQRGWKYLSDDAVPVHLGTGRAHPFPRTPNLRTGPTQMWSEERIRELRKTEIQLDASKVCRDPVAIHGIVLPKFNRDADIRLARIGASETAEELIESAMNLAVCAGEALPLLTGLAKRVPAFRLTYAEPSDAADAALEAFAGQNA